MRIKAINGAALSPIACTILGKDSKKPIPMTKISPGTLQNQLIGLLKQNASPDVIAQKAQEAADAAIAVTLPAFLPPELTNFTCRQSCGHCCRQSSIQIEEADALLLASVTGRSVNYAPVAKSQWQGKACVFLDANNNCSVYSHRPLTCRASLSLDDPDRCRTEESRKMFPIQTVFEALTVGIKKDAVLAERYISSRGKEADIREFFPPA